MIAKGHTRLPNRHRTGGLSEKTWYLRDLDMHDCKDRLKSVDCLLPIIKIEKTAIIRALDA